MDRTAWIIVILCAAGLFFWGWQNKKRAEEYAEARKQAEEQKQDSEAKPADDPEKPDVPETEAKPAPPAGLKTVELQNEKARYELTNQGAGIMRALLLDHPQSREPDSGFVMLNSRGDHPIGALSSAPKAFDETIWEITSQTEREVVFTTVTPEKLRLEKRFTLPAEDQDEHLLFLTLTVRNEDAGQRQLTRTFLYAGSAAPLHTREWSRQSGVFWQDGQGAMKYENVDHFKGGGVLGMGGNDRGYDEFTAEGMRWSGINNQFFTTMIRPEIPYTSTIWGSRFAIELPGHEEESRKRKLHAVEAAVGLPGLVLNSGDQHTLNYEFYIGPKEFARLKALGDGRTAVMNYADVPLFGWMFGWAIKPLASWLIMGLVGLNNMLGGIGGRHAYGIAIIIITIIIRTIIWPVYAKSTRTMKRMSKLTPKMTEIREKYKDDQQKQSEEMMKLYRDYGVNPLGGCLPMFIQLPVFLAFYGMLWRAVELRHEEFLWVKDLSMPDTLFEIGGFPVNLLPIVMAITTFIQMAMTPKTGDKTQRMIFMLMPAFFLVICYNFASALALYWTTQNVFSIGQTWLMNKLPEPELKKKKAPAGGGKKGFFQRMQEQAQAAQQAKQQGGAPAPGGDRTRLASEKGQRHQKSRKRKKR